MIQVERLRYYMPVRSVAEIVKRGPGGAAIPVGMVTDTFLAQQVVDRLYENLRQVLASPNATESILDANLDAGVFVGTQDWDTWSVNNKNSATPVFWFRPRLLWNSVPSVMPRFTMGELGDEYSMFSFDTPNVIAELPPKP
jgi:hypothetical protein